MYVRFWPIAVTRPGEQVGAVLASPETKMRLSEAMRTNVTALIALLAIVATDSIAGERKTEIAQAVAHATTISLLSLEPGENGIRDSEGECAGDCYFGWPVLGQAMVSPDAASSVRKALSAWVDAPEPDAVALCFNPRHGVRLQADGHTYDFVVCFECAQTQVFGDSDPEPIGTLFYAGNQATWDILLSAAGVPLAAQEDSDDS